MYFMRKNILLLSLFAALVTACLAQKQYGVYSVAFYNMENLFDTLHDESKNDYDFLPGGSYRWNKMKYEHKLANMARVLTDLGTDKLPGVGASIVGVAEIENHRVLDDLLKQPAVRERGLKYVHVEGPDKRGIDCALFYNPRFFSVDRYFLQPYDGDAMEKGFLTRGFLTVQGKLAGDPLTVIVCHWPSRGSEAKYRDWAGQQVRHLTDSIMKADKDMRIMVMGDMNDDPDNTSMSKWLGAKRKMKEVGEHDFYNPWWDVLRSNGQGTLTYKGAWNLFDQIVLSRNLLDVKGKKDYRHLKLLNHHVFRRDYLIQQDGRYKGSPLRTSAGGSWLDGFSDHLPTVTYLVKEL